MLSLAKRASSAGSTFVFGAVLAGLAVSSAFAEGPDPLAVSLAKSFAKICILAIPNRDSVTLAAKIEGWRQIEGPPRETAFLPTSSPTQTSWITRGVDDLPIAVTIAHKDASTGTMRVTCAVQNPSVSADAVAKALDGLLPLSPQKEPTSEGTKRITTWNLHYGNREVGIGLVSDTSEKAGAILRRQYSEHGPAAAIVSRAKALKSTDAGARLIAATSVAI